MKTLLWLLVVVCVGLSVTGPIIDPDLWWHLVVGRWIVAHAAIPHVDYWNSFSGGAPWRAYSWAIEVVLALFERWGGLNALMLLKMLLAVALSLALASTYSRLSRDWFFGLVAGVFTIAGCYNHFTLRPQSLVWVLFVLTLLAAEMCTKASSGRRPFVALIALMIMWANCHITTAIGLGAIACWCFGRVPSRRFLAIMLCAFAGTLITPYYGGEWLTFFSKTSHPLSLRAIAEFQPATIMQYSTAFICIGWTFFGVLSYPHFLRLGWGRLVGAAALLLAGLAVVKFLPFALIFVVACCAALWADCDRGLPLKEALRRLQAIVQRLPAEGAAFVLVCFAIVSAVGLWKSPLDRRIVPIEAVDFIESRGLLHPVITDFGRGGYLMYRFSHPNGEPRHKVSIDGRTNVVPAHVMKAYLAAERGEESWREYFSLVDPQTALWNSQSPIIAILKATGDWCEVLRTGDTAWGYVVMITRNQFIAARDLSSPNCQSPDTQS